MKRTFIFPILISAAVLAGCKPGSHQAGNSETAPVTTAANVPAEAAVPVNLPAEIARAKVENKLLLLEFGSSDSCPPCIEFEQRVFSQPEFLTYEKSNLVFIQLDYPLKADLPPAIKATNMLLSQQFDQYMFPTFIALDVDGKEFWRFPGKNNPDPSIDTTLYVPKNFIALLESLKAKAK